MKNYKNFLFDLDGTLYAIDLKKYKGAYFLDFATCVNKLYGVDVQKAYDVFEFTHDKTLPSDYRPNCNKQQIVYEALAKELNLSYDQIVTAFDNIDDVHVKNVNDCYRLFNCVIQAVKYLKLKGYRLVLATNSYFSREKVLSRLAWTGLSSDTFEFINDWTLCDSVKPQKKFFDDILTKLDMKKEETLMVGNNKKQDGGCLTAGIDFYLINDDIEHAELSLIPTYESDGKTFYNFIVNNF